MNIKFLKDEDGEDFDIGDTVIIETTVNASNVFDDTDSLTNVETVEITIEGYNNNVVVDSQSMSNHDTGQYFFEWVTENLDSGDYKITVEAESNGISEEESEWIKLRE